MIKIPYAMSTLAVLQKPGRYGEAVATFDDTSKAREFLLRLPRTCYLPGTYLAAFVVGVVLS